MAQRGPHPLLVLGGLAVVLSLAAGAWLVLRTEEAVAPSGASRVVRPDAAPAEPAEVELPTPAPRTERREPVPEPEPPAFGRLEGRLVRDDRRVVSGGEVEALAGETLTLLGNPTLERLGRSTAVDAGGRFVLEGLPPGLGITLRATGEGFATTDAGPFTLRAGETLEVGDVVVDDGLTIRGWVYDEAGRGVAGAQVALASGTVLGQGVRPRRVVLTDDEGRYSLPAMPREPFVLVASAEGYGNASATGGALQDDGTTVSEIVLRLERARSLEGRLVSREGEALADAAVAAVPRGPGRGGATAVSDADGRFVFDDLVRGGYELRADPEGYLPARADVGADDFDGPPVRLVAREAGRLVGRVVDPRGEPVRAYDMLLRFGPRRGGSGAHLGGTRRVRDPEGRFEITDLGPGWYHFEVWARGFGLTTAGPVRVKPGQQVGGVEITMLEAARVVGRVVTDDGRPVAGARVSLVGNRTAEVAFLRSRVEPEAWHAATRTDADGRFELVDVSPRVYQIEVDHRDFAVERRNDVAARAGEVVTVEDFVLVRSASLRGFATDATGQAVPRVTVMLKGPPGVASRQMRTDGDGAFRFDRLPPGRYALRSTAGGTGFQSIFTSLEQVEDQSLQAAIELAPGQEGVLNVRVER